MALTERQQAILEYIRRFLKENAYPPSIRDIMNALGISSTSVVNYNLNALVREGFIARNRELARGIRLVHAPSGSHSSPELVRIPILGRIGASREPIPVPEAAFGAFADEAIELTRDIVHDEGDIYALEVSGDSMIDALINDGDIVIMKRPTEVRNGDLVAVWLKQEQATTLKRLYYEGERVRLQPANPYLDPIYTPSSNVEVHGKVIMVIRQTAALPN